MATKIYSPKFNFHNRPAISLRLGKVADSYDGEVYAVSESQRRRIAKHFCGVTDCRCNSGALIALDCELHNFGIPSQFCS